MHTPSNNIFKWNVISTLAWGELTALSLLLFDLTEMWQIEQKCVVCLRKDGQNLFERKEHQSESCAQFDLTSSNVLGILVHKGYIL